MIEEDFAKLFERRVAQCREILTSKSAEYSTNGEKLHNFKVAGRAWGVTPECALWGMFLKHYVSVQDIVDKIERDGIVPTKEMVDAKIGDVINYMILLEGLIEDRRKQEELDYPEIHTNVCCVDGECPTECCDACCDYTSASLKRHTNSNRGPDIAKF